MLNTAFKKNSQKKLEHMIEWELEHINVLLNVKTKQKNKKTKVPSFAGYIPEVQVELTPMMHKSYPPNEMAKCVDVYVCQLQRQYRKAIMEYKLNWISIH